MDYREKVRNAGKSGNPAGFVSAKEILERETPSPEDGDIWGRWVYRKAVRCLFIYPYEHVENFYDVDLDTCKTPRAVMDWLLQLSEKTWATADDIGNLLLAIHDIVGVQR